MSDLRFELTGQRQNGWHGDYYIWFRGEEIGKWSGHPTGNAHGWQLYRLDDSPVLSSWYEGGDRSIYADHQSEFEGIARGHLDKLLSEPQLADYAREQISRHGAELLKLLKEIRDDDTLKLPEDLTRRITEAVRKASPFNR